ncbi:hypothetical protein V7S98_19800, partial [Pseudomonas farsensis]
MSSNVLGQAGLLVSGVGSHYIPHQPGTPWPLGCDHYRFTHLIQLHQARFDFTQLDTQPANLHLMVDATGVFDDPIGALARQVARAIQALATAERAGGKALGRQPRAAVVTA